MTSDRHNIAPYPLRLTAELRGSLEESARKVGRSLHAEIVARLDKSFSPIADEGDVLQAVRAISEYSAKFGTSVSVQFSKSRESILIDAIKNGTLPPDATVEDVDNPGPAIARMKAERGDASDTSEMQNTAPPVLRRRKK